MDLFPRLDLCLILNVYMKSRRPRSVFNSLVSFFPFFSGSLCLKALTVESQHSVLRGAGSGSVSDRSAIARHETSFFKLAEWSEQLRPVTFVRLGAVRRRVQIRLCTEQRL